MQIAIATEEPEKSRFETIRCLGSQEILYALVTCATSIPGTVMLRSACGVARSRPDEWDDVSRFTNFRQWCIRTHCLRGWPEMIEWPTMKTWDQRFMELFEKSVAKYRAGDADYGNYYTPKELGFLSEIGYKKREFFDFVEDFCDEGEPVATTALLVAAVRRDYLLTIQNGKKSDKEIVMDDLPGFADELEGMAYFPRIIAKGNAKLRGELDPDIMFSCGGDRNFLSKHGGIHPADFLRHLWAVGDDVAELARWVKEHAAKAG